MRNALIAACLLASTQAAAAQSPPGREAFDYKGVRLGISLAEMREMRAADPHVADARVVCTGDEDVGPISYLGVHVDEAEAAAGLIRCAYFGGSFAALQSDVAPLGMGGGDYVARDYVFEFAPGPNASGPVLFRIELRTNVHAASDVVSALTDRFGAPTRRNEEPIQNQMGAQFTRDVLTWSNETSSITVRAPSGRLNRMSVVYEHTQPAAAFREEVRRRRTTIPNRM